MGSKASILRTAAVLAMFGSGCGVEVAIGGPGVAATTQQAPETTGSGDPLATTAAPPKPTTAGSGSASDGSDPPTSTGTVPDVPDVPDVPVVPFVDVTEELGLAFVPAAPATAPNCVLDNASSGGQPGADCVPERFLGAASVADYDDDGWLDVYITRIDGPDMLMRNLEGAGFEDVAAAAGLDNPTATGSGAWLDVDNDGDLDLMVTTVGITRNLLYINDGTGHFDEQAEARGVDVFTGAIHASMGIGVGDYDLDGYVDLFVADWHRDVPMGNSQDHNRLLRNRGQGAAGFFEDVSETAGITPLRSLIELVSANQGSYGFAPVFVDLDNDGWPEIAMSNDFGMSRLYWNDGAGGFIDATWASGVGTERNGMGSTFADFDRDGDLDWFVSAIWHPQFANFGNRLYRNEGNRTFSDATDQYELRRHGWGWSNWFFDYDLDGDLDLIMAAGWPGLGYSEDPLRFWTNQGFDGAEVPLGWIETSEALGVVEIGTTRGLVPFDYDNDGDLDVLILRNARTPVMYRNETETGHWLKVRTEGSSSNIRGLGARVEVEAVQGGPVQMQQIGVGGHLFSQGDAAAHFGLGEHEGPLYSVRVFWPKSGVATELLDVALDQVVLAVE